jgi:hypothetical protein
MSSTKANKELEASVLVNSIQKCVDIAVANAGRKRVVDMLVWAVPSDDTQFALEFMGVVESVSLHRSNGPSRQITLKESHARMQIEGATRPSLHTPLPAQIRMALDNARDLAVREQSRAATQDADDEEQPKYEQA